MDQLTPPTDAPTRDDLIESLNNHVATVRRMPIHWTARRDSLHAKIDDLITQIRKMDGAE
jgi:nicotinamidase-related amidase